MDDDLKSAFDARKSYSTVVERALMEEKLMANTGDLYRWARSLNTVLSLVVAYLKKEDANTLVERLIKAQNKAASMMGNQKMQASLRIGLDRELREIEYDIHRKAASFFWPTTSPGDDKFDLDEFMRGSGL